MTDTLIIPPDPEKLLVQFLLEQDEVAAFVADRVYTALPKDRTYPCVRVTLQDRVPQYAVALFHEEARLQVDVFGGSKGTTRRCADTCRAAIAARIVAWPHDEAKVQLATFNDMGWLPDATLSPGEAARPRYLFAVTLRLRPVIVRPS